MEEKVDQEDLINEVTNNKKKFPKRSKGTILADYYRKTMKDVHEDLIFEPLTNKKKMRILANMKQMNKEMGMEFAKKFIRMCILDWEAIRDKMKKEEGDNLPQYPNIILIFSLRKHMDLNNAAYSGDGVTTKKHRVSNFASEQRKEGDIKNKIDDNFQEWLNQ